MHQCLLLRFVIFAVRFFYVFLQGYITNSTSGLHCAFTHRLIKAKACRLLLSDLCRTLGTGGRSSGWSYVYLSLRSLGFATEQTTSASPPSWSAGERGVRRGCLRGPQPEEGKSRASGCGWGGSSGHCGVGGIATASWPEHGWKLLGSSTACRWLNPSGWLY